MQKESEQNCPSELHAFSSLGTVFHIVKYTACWAQKEMSNNNEDEDFEPVIDVIDDDGSSAPEREEIVPARNFLLT